MTMSAHTQTARPHTGATVQMLAVLAGATNAVEAALKTQNRLAVEYHDAQACIRMPWRAGELPDLILLEPPAGDQERLTNWLQDIAATAPSVPVLVLGELLSADTVRALLALDKSNVIALPFTHSGLAGQIRALLSDSKKAGGNSARVWSFMPAVGGAGATTLATETAFQLHCTQTGNNRVALIDLNFIDGACAASLNVAANLRLDEVAADPERIDEALIDAFASPHPCGFDVLVAGRSLTGFDAINARAVARLLDVCCGIYAHVVIDLSRWVQDWTLDVLAGSDVNIIVSELTVPALHAARDLAQTLEAESTVDDVTMQIVLNRMAKRVFGHSISMADAQKALGRKALCAIGSDWDSAVQAVNYGVPVGQASPKSKLSKDVQGLLKSLHQQMLNGGAGTAQRMAS